MRDFNGAPRALPILKTAAVSQNDGTAVFNSNDDGFIRVHGIYINGNNIHSVEQPETVQLLLACEETILTQRVSFMKVNVPANDFVLGEPVSNNVDVVNFHHVSLTYLIRNSDFLLGEPFNSGFHPNLHETAV